ncbi:MAG: hypothetical protein ACRDCA_12390 [Serratia sp. (in: enterobacteria)]|uniref:hypothetical protein n=1 Tax=Serratia sp. (in: enterobacteria) TaxID=616 RepID=UPI003F2AF8F9
MNLYENAFSLAFQKTPILLVDGIAESIPGGIMPIAVLTDGLSLVNGLLQGKLSDTGLDAELLTTNFRVVPGSTLIAQDVGTYPFFNMATAGNATIKRPNRVTMNMLKPATTRDGGYITKPITFTGIKMALDKHHELGGTYTILTPAFIYAGCVMRSMTDISGFSDQIKQVQYEWAFEFEQPLLYISQLDIVMGNLMDKFTQGVSSPGGNVWSTIKQSISGLFPS